MEDKNQLNGELNIAGKFARVFIHSKITLLIIIGSLLFGIYALDYTPRTYNPEIVAPAVKITVSRPGNSPEEMLNQIVRPLEAIMSSIQGVEHTFGIALDDMAVVTVRFEVGRNEEESLVKVYNQLNSNMDRMPEGTNPPLVQSISLYDVALVTITLSSASLDEMMLREAGNHLLEAIRNIPNVGKTWITGSSATAVRVWLDPEKLSSRFIALEKVKEALGANNIGSEVGKLEPSDQTIPLRLNAELLCPEDVGNVIVGIYDGKPVYLKEVATIEEAPASDEVRSYFAYGKGSGAEAKTGDLNKAVTLALARQKGSNGVEVAEDILSRLELYKNSKLPADINVTVTRNYGRDADEAVNHLMQHLGIAILAVGLILLFFLGWREASLVMISIPIIFSIVLGISWISGYTINRVTVFSLILTLGLLVDDSIVVIENIHRHILIGKFKDLSKLIVHAVDEIGIPTIVATFTVILALLPLIFISGMMGPYIAPIPFNAPIAMLTSLLVAYSVIPFIAYCALRRAHVKIQEGGKEPSLDHSIIRNFYIRSIEFLIHSKKNRHIFYACIAGAIFLVFMQPLWQFIRPSGTNGPVSPLGVEVKLLPNENGDSFLIEIDAEAGSSVSITQGIAREISSILAENPYVTNYQIFQGEDAPPDFASMVKVLAFHDPNSFAQIRVNLIDKHDRSIKSHAIAKQLYHSLAPVRNKYPRAHIKLFETPPGPPVSSQMEAGLYGPDYGLLRELGDYIEHNIYPVVYGMINIDNSVTRDLAEYQIRVDPDTASRAGFVPEKIANTVKAYFEGVPAGYIHNPESRESQDIILRLPVHSRENVAALEKLLLMDRLGQMVPLAQIAEITEVIKAKPIYTRDQHQIVYLTGEMLISSPVYGVLTVKHLLNNRKLADGTNLIVNNLGLSDAQPNDINENQLFWYGEMRMTLDVLRDLSSILLVTLLLIYFLLIGIYRSFTLPLIIMGAIPLTLIGVFPGHWIMNQPFTATSMIGVIALSGIVVRNSLLLIDFILEDQKRGTKVVKAVVDAGKVRVLPILLTAMAIILGSCVMVTDPVFGGLAISLIFGALASTTLTLYVIPLAYLTWWRRIGAKRAHVEP